MKRTKKPKWGWPIRLVILIFAVWSAVTLISLQGQINQLKAEGAEIEAARAAQELRNVIAEESSRVAGLIEEQRSNSTTSAEAIGSDIIKNEYARIAREKLGFVYPEELIIIDKTP